MLIPYQYNKMAAGGTVIDPNAAKYGSRGVFTFLRNGSCNQSAMTIRNRYLVSSAVSRMEVSSAGLALNTTVNYGASVFVRDSGTASATVVNSGGNVQVSFGGVAIDTELNYNGYLYVSPVGSANAGNIHSGGRVCAYSNTGIRGFHVSLGGSLYGQGSNVTFDGITVSSGANFTPGNSPGVAVLNAVVDSNASVWCQNSNVFSHATVMSGGFLGVSSGGKCFDAIVASGGRVNHGVWGYDGETSVTGTNHLGSFYTVNGTACNYVLMGGQDQQLYYYASAISTVMSSGGSQFVSFGAVAQFNTIFQGGYQRVLSSGLSLDTVISSGGQQFAEYFGTAVRTTVGSGAYMYVSNNGRAADAEIRQGGSQFVSFGAAVTSTNISGWQMLSNGCSALNTTVNSGAWQYVRYACSASDATVMSGGSLHISQNCSYGGIKVSNGGWLGVYEGCAVSGVVFGQGMMYLCNYCGGTNISIGSGGTLYASYFCNLENVVVSSGGVFYLHSSNCNVTSTTIESGGSFYLSRFNNASGVTVGSGGLLYVASAASAFAVTSSAGAIITVEAGGFIQYTNNG